MARGKKDCPNCNTEIGCRTQLCNCGWHYPSGKVRADLLAQRPSLVEKKVHTTAGRGRKQCPECPAIVGVRTQTCECGFDFSNLVAKRVEEKEKEKIEKISSSHQKAEIPPEVAKYLAETDQTTYAFVPKEIPCDHAKRILSYGEERARTMLLQHKIHHFWSHVDWKYVEEQLALKAVN